MTIVCNRVQLRIAEPRCENELRNERTPWNQYPAEEFRRRTRGPCTVAIVSDCDHFYNGREQAVRSLVCAWLAKTVPAGA